MRQRYVWTVQHYPEPASRTLERVFRTLRMRNFIFHVVRDYRGLYRAIEETTGMAASVSMTKIKDVVASLDNYFLIHGADMLRENVERCPGILSYPRAFAEDPNANDRIIVYGGR